MYLINGPDAAQELKQHRAGYERARLQEHLSLRREWLIALIGQLLADDPHADVRLRDAADGVLTDQTVLAEILDAAREQAVRAAASAAASQEFLRSIRPRPPVTLDTRQGRIVPPWAPGTQPSPTR